MTGKEAAALAAAQLISPKTVVGLGSGSTAELFIHALAKRALSIQCVASSIRSATLAESLGLAVFDINAVPQIDIVVDGADQIDPSGRMIKGGGGAHVREKILASTAREMVVIVDSSKVVQTLGGCKLPVEILIYGCWATLKKIERLGYRGSWRQTPAGAPLITDNGNLLLDLDLPARPPEEIHEELLHIPGVVDTGFFFNYARRVIVGHPDGTTKCWDAVI